MFHPLLESYRNAILRSEMIKDPAQENAVHHLSHLYDEITREPSFFERLFSRGGHKNDDAIAGVYLYGPVGRGKTRVMDLFFDALPDSIQKERVHFHAFMLSVHAAMHQSRQAGGQTGVDDVLPRFSADVARRTRVLCFDEFHVTDVADAMILSRLFSALFAAGVRVVMTSNLAPDDLYPGGLQRDLFLPFIALVKTRMDIVAVDGDQDYRRAALALPDERTRYFTPLGYGAQAWADTVFAHLSAPEEGGEGPVMMDVMGHTVHIPRARGGVAMADFSDLCERPLAAQDYLAVAERFHTLILTRVPRLTYDRRNETKRFILLIDVLYERRVHLYLSAAAEADHLYVDAGHAFEFDRTVSRLIEMQGAGYPS